MSFQHKTALTMAENHSSTNNSESSDDEESEQSDPPTPDFTDQHFGEDLSDDQLCPDLMAERPQKEDDSRNVIIIDNLPIVDEAKLVKLRSALAKVFQCVGGYRKDFHPFDNNGRSKGYGFFEFETEQMAIEAQKIADGLRLDRNYTLSAILVSNYDQFTRVPPEPIAIDNLYSWLWKTGAVDQFAIQSDNRKLVSIYENTRPEPTLLTERARWSELIFNWSPKGTYFVSFHPEGIILWGGEEFQQIQRCKHSSVNYIHFSPCERYMITVSLNPTNAYAFILWDVITGVEKRTFPFDRQNTWGSSHFKWAFDDQYFARQGPDGIYVYTTKTFQLVNSKPFCVPSLVDFQWSPIDHRLAFWTAEDGNVAGRLVVAEIKENRLEEIRSKTLFNVIQCTFDWQKRGDYLVVHVLRYTKKSGDKLNPKYSGVLNNFEIFYMREKSIPLDTFEVKETVQSFAVEPDGHKLAVITGEQLRTQVIFYRMGQGQKNGKIEMMGTIAQPVNRACWSPSGQYIVLAMMKADPAPGGLLVFVDTNEMTIMGKQEHLYLSDVEWDPTGRYVATSVNAFNARRDHSLKIWTFDGSLFFEKAVEQLRSFHWRPRPRSLLNEEMLRRIRRDRSVWTRQFAREDHQRSFDVSETQRRERRRMAEEFQYYKERAQRRLARLRPLNNRVGFDQSLLDADEEAVEFLVETTEVECKP